MVSRILADIGREGKAVLAAPDSRGEATDGVPGRDVSLISTVADVSEMSSPALLTILRTTRYVGVWFEG